MADPQGQGPAQQAGANQMLAEFVARLTAPSSNFQPGVSQIATVPDGGVPPEVQGTPSVAEHAQWHSSLQQLEARDAAERAANGGFTNAELARLREPLIARYGSPEAAEQALRGLTEFGRVPKGMSYAHWLLEQHPTASPIWANSRNEEMQGLTRWAFRQLQTPQVGGQ